MKLELRMAKKKLVCVFTWYCYLWSHQKKYFWFWSFMKELFLCCFLLCSFLAFVNMLNSIHRHLLWMFCNKIVCSSVCIYWVLCFMPLQFYMMCTLCTLQRNWVLFACFNFTALHCLVIQFVVNLCVCVWCDAVVCLSAKLLFELLGKLTNFSTDDAVIYSLWIKILASSRAYQMRRIEILKQLVPKKQVNYRRSQYYSDTKTYLRS